MSICFSQISVSLASYSENDLLQVKHSLEKSESWKAYIEALNAMIPTLGKDKLHDIQERAILAQIKFSNLSGKKYDEIKTLVEYIDILISKELEERILENQLSDEKKNAVEKELMYMQQSLHKDTLSALNELIINWNELTHYQEKWNFDMNMFFDVDNIASINGGVSLHDYVSQTQFFDQSFIWKLTAFADADIRWEEMNLSLATNLDVISKDGQIYLKMGNIDLQDHSKEDNIGFEITPYIEKFEELSKDSTYLSFVDENSQLILEAMKNLSQDGIEDRLDTIFTTALFEAYSEEGGEYLLRPTLHFCNTGKELSEIFDPFSGKTCSDSQYKNMLHDFHNSGISMKLKTWNTNVITMQMQGEESSYMNIEWSRYAASKIELFIAEQWYEDDNYFSLIFIPKKELKIDFKIEDKEVMWDANFLFNRDGSMKEFSGNIKQGDMNWDEWYLLNVEYSNSQFDFILDSNIDDVLIKCNLNGIIKADYADLSGACNMKSQDIEYIIPNTQELDMNMEIMLDVRSSKNNIDFDLNILSEDAKIFNMNMKNTGTRRSIPSQDILAPKNIKSLNEFMQEIYEESYDYDF